MPQYATQQSAIRRAVRLLTLSLLLGGCASGGAAGKAATRSDDMGGSVVQTAVLQNAGGGARGMNMLSTTEVNSTVVAASPEQAFQALSAAYGQLGIPVTDLNQAARTLGNTDLRVRRRIGDVQTVRAFDCGGDSGMPNAETYQLRLTVQSRVIPSDAGGSVIQTTVEGTGRNATTTASSDVRCSSKGVLEQRIAALVKAKLAGGG